MSALMRCKPMLFVVNVVWLAYSLVVLGCAATVTLVALLHVYRRSSHRVARCRLRRTRATESAEWPA